MQSRRSLIFHMKRELWGCIKNLNLAKLRKGFISHSLSNWIWSGALIEQGCGQRAHRGTSATQVLKPVKMTPAAKFWAINHKYVFCTSHSFRTADMNLLSNFSRLLTNFVLIYKIRATISRHWECRDFFIYVCRYALKNKKLYTLSVKTLDHLTKP